MLIGYARVSTSDQSLDLQTDALNKAGCVKVFTDQASGAQAERPGLEAALSFAREGDTLAVWKLDRLGRSLKNLIETTTALQERGIAFKSLQESIDTTTAAGRMFFHVLGALAEFERELIRERTSHGLKAARARGNPGGRRALLDEKKLNQARAMRKEKIPISQICETLKVSDRTLRRSLRRPLKTPALRGKNP